VKKEAKGKDDTRAAKIARAAHAREGRKRERVPVGKEVLAARAVVKPTFQLLTKTDVVAKCGCSYQSIWEAMRRGEFPRSRRFLGKVVWFSTEVDAYLQGLPLQTLKDASPIEDDAPVEAA
jgi:predicted DNA-binding transcriptional regulator AlpA